MSRSELKTKVTEASVDDYLDTIPDEKRRADTIVVTDMMAHVTGHEPKLWGTSIIGFDSYHYKRISREGELPIIGVAARKQALTIYIMPGFEPYGELMDRLGKYKTGRSCLYIKRLEDVDFVVLEEIVRRSVADMRARYAESDNERN